MMEPPIVPFSPRSRLVRDYSQEDIGLKRNIGDGRPRGYDVDHPSRGPSLDMSSDGRTTALRVRSPERPEDHSRSLSQVSQPYQDVPSQRNGHMSPSDDLRKLDFNLTPVDEDLNERSYYEPSVSSITHSTAPSQTTGITSTSGSRLPDFFSSEIFQVVLHNPTTSHQLLKFSQSRLCGENLEFLEKVDRYQSLLNDVAKTIYEIHKDFISVNAPNQVNLPDPLLVKVNKDLKTALATTLPKLESVFVDSQNDIERLVSLDVYPRFVRHQMAMSAAKALGGNRGKYAGLGDCFVLTDPSKADNPITFASDGFVKVTGYPRNEIIPRNCRFLQTRMTDKSAVKRLRNAIAKREESVELLLNQKKNGEPFWNLLYTAPLFDARGNVVFFLGGQINCSTTIHSQSDILKILAMSTDVEEEKDLPPTIKNTRSSRLFSAFRGSKVNVQVKAGMESGLVEKIEAEKLNLQKQMDVFYTAYSKVRSFSHSKRLN
jgi:phototropin